MATTQVQTKSGREGSVSRWFEPLVGLVALTILVQSLVAGIFIDNRAGSGVISVHGGIADASWILAGITAVYAFRTLRQSQPTLWRGAAALFVLDLVETGIGHLITGYGHNWLITVHVPLALIIFGLALWLSLHASRLRPAN